MYIHYYASYHNELKMHLHILVALYSKSKILHFYLNGKISTSVVIK